MKIFACSHCANTVYFENNACEACGSGLGYEPVADAMIAVPQASCASDGSRLCANAESGGCNWLVEPGSPDCFCLACRHNGVIPNLAEPDNLRHWRRIEEAKRRMVYSLLRWRLPVPTRQEDPEKGLVFEFLADAGGDAPRVMTGHADGRITIALAEADDVERERRRTAMGEPYRTLLGHFRHEIGHFYWDLIVRGSARLNECRMIFGDDRQDYGAALERHHAQGPPADWQGSFVSAYATTHPWEDFAETWAHCMHIVDALDTASCFGMTVEPETARSDALTAAPRFDPYRAGSFERVLDAWLPVSIAVNAINRSMGAPDLYPFVLTPAVTAKLAFVHGLIREAGR